MEFDSCEGSSSGRRISLRILRLRWGERRMSFLKIVLSAAILTIVLFLQASGSENYTNQVSTVILFYKTLTEKKSPSVSDFYQLFGRSNEAELELILRQQFPSLELKGNWLDDEEAITYVDKVRDNPQDYPSRFLQCLKSMEPRLFSDKVNRQIEIPPIITKDFRKFTVITAGRLVGRLFLSSRKMNLKLKAFTFQMAKAFIS
jgi:hypothetical protein